MIPVVSVFVTGAALISYFMLAIITIQSGIKHKEKQVFLIYICAMIYWQFGALLVTMSQTLEQARFWYGQVSIGSVISIFLFLLLVRVILGMRNQKLIVYSGGLYTALLLVLGIGTDWQVLFPAFHLGNGGFFIPEIDLTSAMLLAVPEFGLYGLSMVYLIKEYTGVESPYVRNRIKYILLGGSMIFLGILLNLTPLQDYPVDMVCNLVNAILLGYAIIKYRLLEIRMFILETLFYTVISGTILGIHILSIALITQTILFYQIINFLVFVEGIITASLVILLQPAKNRFDKIFYRERNNYQHTLARFSAAILSARDPKKILEQLVTTITGTIRTDNTMIMLLNEDGSKYHVKKHAGSKKNNEISNLFLEKNKEIVNWLVRTKKPLIRDEAVRDSHLRAIIEENSNVFDNTGISVIIPIFLQQELVGIVNLGDKRSGEVYSDEDLQYLGTLVNQTAVAYDNAVLYQDLEKIVHEKAEQLIKKEQQFLEQERSVTLGRLAGNIAHDINNPLQYVRGSVEFLLDSIKAGTLDPDDSVTSLETIIEGCDRITETCSRLRRISRGGESTIFDLQSVIDTAIILTKGKWNEVCEEITVEHNNTETPLLVKGVENDIAHVFMNMIINAAQAIENHGNIHIKLYFSDNNRYIVTEIRDTGKGIPPEILDKLGKEAITTKSVDEGTGLGLLGVYNVVKQHQGMIDVVSTLGRGTVFRVKLPAVGSTKPR
ncbi:MAG: ATP-binding protein [Candidatus Odinarchaeota archaeon]